MLYQRAIKRHGSAEAASKWVLPPEKSNHPWGIAIDINYGVGGTKGKKAAAWLEKMATYMDCVVDMKMNGGILNH